MRKDFYKDEGIEVDKIQMQPAIGVKALMSGDVDYLLAWGSALRAAVSGVPIKAVLGFAGRPLHVLIARPEIKTPKDLKGKIIGVDSVAGTVDYLSRVAVRHFGFEPEKDVKIIVTGESPTRLAALRAGAIDATPIDVAFAVKAEDEGFQAAGLFGRSHRIAAFRYRRDGPETPDPARSDQASRARRRARPAFYETESQ